MDPDASTSADEGLAVAFHGVTLRVYAGIRIAIGEGFELSDVLAQEGVAHTAWPVADRRWREALVDSPALQLELLEHEVIVVSLVRELLDRGLAVSIGSENQLEELRDCSIVLAPYEIDGQSAGVVGILGPTRMNYRHALSAVSVVSDQLGRHLDEVRLEARGVGGVGRDLAARRPPCGERLGESDLVGVELVVGHTSSTSARSA